MSGTKIANLPAAGTLVGDEIIPLVQDDVTVKTTAQEIADLGALAPANVGLYLGGEGPDDPPGFKQIQSNEVAYSEVNVETALTSLFDVTDEKLPVTNGALGQVL